ncbi:hypothetical protein QOZ88_11485 [Blastococcus sp. BMG 814]|uniref:DUF2029 domain-containing protein n=1 Tax=Blastococcus carthaginiensis TaxID=3050034 RepID=A0ABT9ICI1_9ACTN|nr:hypothetical protein [Blastococcus carthaginiensis]MDP5183262.1 hypothetical protein [Blastococcus carthaginiensis]
MQTNVPPSDTARAVGRATFAAAVAGTVLAPLHALSRYATADGAEDLEGPLVRAWAEPATDLVAPLLTWSDPDTVYLSYGKLWLPVLVVVTICAVLVRRRRAPDGLERWAWPIALTGYALATAALLGQYWTPWLDESFVFLGVPGLLASLAGSTLLGVALLRRGFRPRATGWLLALWLPAVVAISTVMALGAALLPMVWAWALASRSLDAERTVPAPVDAGPRH